MKFSATLIIVILFVSFINSQLPPLPTGPSPLLVSSCIPVEDNEQHNNLCFSKTDLLSCNAKRQCIWRDGGNQNELANFNNDEYSPPRIITIIPNLIYEAIGYGISTNYIIKSDTGFIMIDALEATSSNVAVGAAEAYASLFNMTVTDFKNDIHTVILTHHHADHYYGLKSWVENRTDVNIWAHQNFLAGLGSDNQNLPRLAVTTIRQTGRLLPSNSTDGLLSAGIGPYLGFTGIFPELVGVNVTFMSDMTVNIDGINMTMTLTPGETSSEIFVYLTDYNVGFVGDNYYNLMANLYAIRGTTVRDPRIWANSNLRIVNEFPNIEYLCPSHGQPVIGNANVIQTLTNYSLAMYYIHDYTVSQINMQKHIDDIASSFEWPEQFADLPYLRDFYGNIKDYVKSVYTLYYGHFTGDVSELIIETTLEQAQYDVDLCESISLCVQRAERFLEDKKLNSAFKLADSIRKVLHSTGTFDNLFYRATDTFIWAGEQLAYTYRSSSNRNYILTVMLQTKVNKEAIIH